MTGLQVTVVGGSLSGLAFALACAARGISTRVLERVQDPDRGGAALGIDRPLLLRVIKANANDVSGIASFPILTARRNATSWTAVHTWLRREALQRPEISLKEGTAVVEVAQNAESATVLMADGQRINAAVVVGADGYRSVVRRAIKPEQPYALYAGYLLWRGLVFEADLPFNTPLMENNDGVALSTLDGHRLIAYFVAGPSGSLEVGERQISFAWYDRTRTGLLRRLGCLSSPDEVVSSLNSSEIPRVVLAELTVLAKKLWPDPWRSAIEHALECGKLFATPAAEYFPERLCQGRLAIIGDAAHIVTPVTGNGFSASLLDVEVLAECLASARDTSVGGISRALESFAIKRLPDVQTLVANSLEMSRAYVQEGKFPTWQGWKKKVKNET